MHQSFISYKNFLYLKISLVFCFCCIVAYLIHDSLPSPSGGTWLGYALGTISVILVFWLASLGVRKRNYSGTKNNAVGWVSAHVYLGSSLLVVTTLHSGMQFGLNVHFVAYFLTITVVLSGFYGLYAYAVYPTRITQNRSGLTREIMFEMIAEIDQKCLHLADKVSAEMYTEVLRSVESARIGTNLMRQIFSNKHREDDYIENTKKYILKELDKPYKETIQTEDLNKIYSLLKEKSSLMKRIDLDLRYSTRLTWWLYLHVPLTVTLITSLFVHVFVVFYYW